MGPLTFYFDRTFGTRLPKALASMRPPARIKWHQDQGFAPEMPDDEWLSVVGPRQWVVLSQDRKFHVRENEAAAIKQHSVRCFYLPCASESRWVSLCHFVRWHVKIGEKANSEAPPFIYELKSSGHMRKVILL